MDSLFNFFQAIDVVQVLFLDLAVGTEFIRLLVPLQLLLDELVLRVEGRLDEVDPVFQDALAVLHLDVHFGTFDLIHWLLLRAIRPENRIQRRVQDLGVLLLLVDQSKEPVREVEFEFLLHRAVDLLDLV